MRLLALFCTLLFAAAPVLADSFRYTNNPAIALHFGDEVSENSRRNILEGLRRVEAFFEEQTGDVFQGEINIVAYHNDRYFRKMVPSRYRYRMLCGGGSMHHGKRGGDIYYVVICLSSWPFENAAAKGADRLAERERDLVIHEMTHVMQAQWRNHKTYARGEPYWIREADANYIGQVVSTQNERSYASAIARMGRNSDPSVPLRKIKTIDDFAKYLPKSFSNTASAHKWLIDNFGIEAVKAYWVATGEGQSYKAAFETAYGISLNDFYSRFTFLPQ